jgi:hypothetical protein
MNPNPQKPKAAASECPSSRATGESTLANRSLISTMRPFAEVTLHGVWLEIETTGSEGNRSLVRRG